MTTRLHLYPQHVSETETLLASVGSGNGMLRASMFRFSTGVGAVRLQNDLGELVILPWQGQQIWSAAFGAEGVARRSITMQSMVREPKPTQDFLDNFGAFLVHCGLLGVGGPSADDTHPLHGELPNALFQQAWLEQGEDARGTYLGIGGEYRHTRAFTLDYAAQPMVKLYAGSSLFSVEMDVVNHKQSPMDMFYLAHVNYLPVDGARLVYSAQRTPEHLRVHTDVPAHITPRPGYVEALKALAQDPTRHEIMGRDEAYNPEAVIFIDYEADSAGWAHTMQVHADGSADYLRHRPEQLPHATRWISRTPDQDAIAIAEVGTCEPRGATRETASGHAVTLQGGERFHAQFDAGVLAPAEAARVATGLNRTA